MTLFEAQDASDIVANAATGDVNIILGTSINEELGDEIRVTVIATGIDPTKKENKGRTSRQNQIHSIPQKPVLDMEQAKPMQPEDDNAFGDWDIRKEQTVRPKVDDTQFENIEKKEFDTFNRDDVKSGDDDELSTPPFFRRKR